jgi:hypothetical protein
MASLHNTLLSNNFAHPKDTQEDVSEIARRIALNGKNSSKEEGTAGSATGSSSSLKEVFDARPIDPVLAKKMALVNQAIDDIGMTTFQWKLFFLNGFGYAVDSVSGQTCLCCIIRLILFIIALGRLSINRKSGCESRVWIT